MKLIKQKYQILQYKDQYKNVIIEYHKTITLVERISNEISKFKAKCWVEINHDLRVTYNTNGQIKFKNTMLKSTLCDYSDAYIFAKRRITITGPEGNTTAMEAHERKKRVIFKNCAPFTNCINEINNT